MNIKMQDILKSQKSLPLTEEGILPIRSAAVCSRHAFFLIKNMRFIPGCHL